MYNDFSEESASINGDIDKKENPNNSRKTIKHTHTHTQSTVVIMAKRHNSAKRRPRWEVSLKKDYLKCM